MGIEAFCPNGHRIAVKHELAGKKVLCPNCGKRFRIPDAPDGPVSRAGRGASGRGASGLPVARPISVNPSVVATLPRATPFPAAPPRQPAVSSGPVPAVSPPNWYVVMPGQQPAGPMPTERIAAEAAAGRCPAGTLVWQEGWPDWKPIGEFFQAPAAALEAVVEPAVEVSPVRTRRVIRGRSGGGGAVFSVVLVLLVAAAAAAAWHILRSRGIIR